MALSANVWAKYAGDNDKLRGESSQSVDSGHVVRFVYDSECSHVSATEKAPLKKDLKKYNVKVSSDFH